jgi:LuxR family transcriptional regulator, maltose regulon positive regulatory protein
VPSSLLLTKFYLPHLRAEHLLRPRLTRRLDEVFARKLTLVCAPAGYGKTTLIAEWVAGRTVTLGTGATGASGHVSGPRVAWLSLDAGDSDPVRFLTYLVAALRQIDPVIGRGVESMLQGVPPPPYEALLTALINDLVFVPFPFILVLDDYHLITSLAVHLMVAFLLDHQPPNMHLVIATRDDPPLPLATWRAKGQMVEIRQGDLQFTAEETLAFLQRATQTELSAAGIAAVQQRTEGWAAGLELLAHSLRGCDDVPGLLESFTGSNRHVLDYLMEEVFQRQPTNIQDFLLKTSVLGRMNASLCEAITERADSDALLLTLERRNLFVVPLDHSRQWYRYHHLFGDLLRHRLDLQAPDRAAQLHHRACRWYAENGFPTDAIQHALAAHAWEEAAALISRLGADLLKRGEVTTLLGWFRALPDRLVRSNSQLCADYSWPLLLSGQVDKAERYLALAEQGAGGDGVLAGSIAAARAYAARIKGDGRRAVEMSERALALLPADDWQTRSAVAANLGMAYWYAGNLNRSEQVLGEAEESSRRSENAYAGLAAKVFLCKVEAARGRLRSATAAYRRAIQEAGDMPLVALAHADLAKLLYDQNDLTAAVTQAQQAAEMSRRSGQPELQIAARRTLALIEQARGEQAAAQQALAETRQLARHPALSPSALRHALAYRTLIALMAGDLDEARALADESPTLDEIGSLPDYVLLSLARARLLLAEGRQAEVYELLRQREAWLLPAGFMLAHVDTRVLQALAASTEDEALRFLAEALALAAPEGYVRAFVDLGPSMAALLRKAAVHTKGAHTEGTRSGSGSTALEFISRLLAAFRAAEHRGGQVPSGSQPLIDPLSERELEVLRLLAGGNTNDEIGRSLYVSANTVKAHLKSIYRKLDVNSRHEATGQARQLGLL